MTVWAQAFRTIDPKTACPHALEPQWGQRVFTVWARLEAPYFFAVSPMYPLYLHPLVGALYLPREMLWMWGHEDGPIRL